MSGFRASGMTSPSPTVILTLEREGSPQMGGLYGRARQEENRATETARLEMRSVILAGH